MIAKQLFLAAVLGAVVVAVPAMGAGSRLWYRWSNPTAKPVTVEHIKVPASRWRATRGDAIDQDVIVFLPPSYAR